MLGYAADELTGRRAIDLVQPRYRPRVLASVDAVLRRGEPAAVVPLSFASRSGAALPAFVALAKMADNAAVSAALGEAPVQVFRRAADRRPGLVVTVLPTAQSAAALDPQPTSGRAGGFGSRSTDRLSPPRITPPRARRLGDAARGRHDLPSQDAAARTASPLTAPPLPDARGFAAERGPITAADPRAAVSPDLLQLMQTVMATVSAVGGLVADSHAAIALVLDRLAGTAQAPGPSPEAAPSAWAAPSSVGSWAPAPPQEGAHSRPPDPDRAADGGTDSLTGLSTRSLLVDELDNFVMSDLDVALLLVDLDEFKEVNDLHGHDVGDEVLVHVAQRLRLCVRPDDLVVRFGGDEFVILCQGSAAAVTVAERVVGLLSAPIGTTAGAVSVTASVGIADRTIPIQVSADLLSRADAAMYHAKRSGKNQYFVYDAALHSRTAEDKATERLLRKAVLDRRIRVHYQPIMAANGVDVVGVEAVARLVDDDGQVRMPADFLPIAERTGLVGALDAWVLMESCRCIAEVSRNLGQSLAVSVNVSAQFVARADLAEVVNASLLAAGQPPSALMLEISEEALDHLSPASMAALKQLRRDGVRVALDNFGTDSAQLSALRRLPLSHVKVDRPSIARMLGDDRDLAVIEAVTWLVDRLGLTWIAEGVETDEQWQAVQRFGPGLAQGFLFAAPLDEADLRRALGGGGLPGGFGGSVGSNGLHTATLDADLLRA